MGGHCTADSFESIRHYNETHRPLSADIAEQAGMRGTSTYNDFDKNRAQDKARAEQFQKDLDELRRRYERLVLKDAFEQEQSLKPQQLPPRSDLLWVGVDLDGTLAKHLWTPSNPTSEIGDPIPEAVEKVRELVALGYKIIVHTSRPWTDYENIENWMRFYGIPFKEIQCGKPLYVAYIDDRAINASEDSWIPKTTS